MAENSDKAAPMASAPIKYNVNGDVDWGNMWDNFCALPREGGPAHRATMLEPQADSDIDSPEYKTAVDEIVRGIYEVSGLPAQAGPAGWIAVDTPAAAMATWLSEAITDENVSARHEDKTLFVPVGASFTLKGEIKNVITAVAKTTHYYADHLHPDVKRTLEMQARFSAFGERVSGLFKRKQG